MKIAAFARLINYDRNYLARVVSGEKKPGLKLAKLIEQYTQGIVTVEDQLNLKKENMDIDKEDKLTAQTPLGQEISISKSDAYRILLEYPPEVAREAIEELQKLSGPTLSLPHFLRSTAEKIMQKKGA